MIRVMANGCFDCLHIGHVRHLQAARALGDILIVALTIDEEVHKGPGRPVFTWAERAEMLRALKCVDEIFPSWSFTQAIQQVMPDVAVKGKEYEHLGSYPNTRTVYLDTPTYSSTKILTGELLRERIRAAEQSGE